MALAFVRRRLSFFVPHILFIRFLGAVIRRLIFKPAKELVRYVDSCAVADEHKSDGDTFWHGLVSFLGLSFESSRVETLHIAF